MNRAMHRRRFLKQALGAGVGLSGLPTLASAATPSAGSALNLQVSSRILQPDWRGFGYQDSLFLWMEHQGRRVTDEDVRLNVERVKAMRPSLVRQFVIMPWWNPSPNVYTWGSEGMKNLYQVLDLYKSLGTEVVLTVWGRLPDWMHGDGNVPAEMFGFGRSVTELIEYLNRVKGYRHIRYLVLYNEPDLEFKPPDIDAFNEWARMVKVVNGSLKKRKLRGGLKLIGPDDALSADWLKKATTNLADVLDIYDSHHYDDTAEGAANWIGERMKIVQGSAAPKPFWITEFGRGQKRDDYDYGLFIAQYAASGLNAGVGAMLLWNLVDMYFPGETGINDWGLWRYKDDGWRVRPVFYLYSLLTRFAGKEMKVQAVEGAGGGIQAAYLSGKSGETLLVVNPGDARDVAVSGLTGKTFGRYHYTETAVQKANGKPLEPEESVKPDGGSLRDNLPGRSVTVYTTVSA